MTYLSRRIEHLIKRLREGKISLSSEFALSDNGQKLIEDLEKVQQLDDGTVDLSTCTQLVRTVAKTLFALEHCDFVSEKSFQNDVPVDLDTVSRITKEYFQLLENFFVEATGVKPKDFEFEEYKTSVLAAQEQKSELSRRAFGEYSPKIIKFLSENNSLLYGASKTIGGLKCVLSGSSRFPRAAFDGIRKFALYADTIFIPDPLLPWLEVQREEERFPIIEFLLNCHQLLLLKPLADAELSYPAIVVFPSWEKSFELHDIEAKDGISQLILGFFSHYLNASFEDETEIIEHIQGNGKNYFEEAVTKYGLFWPPEEDGPLSFNSGYQKYKKWLQKWRSQEWLDEIGALCPHLLVFNGILERLTPQFHARDNSTSLDALPLFWLSPNFHYYQLTSAASNSVLKQAGIVGQQTHSSLQSLLHPKVAWLGNISIEAIARLREENANETFRHRINSYVRDLNQAHTDDLDRVALDVMRGLQSLLDEHDREAKKILDDFERRLLLTLGSSVLTLAASLYPWLEPWIGLTIFAPMAKAGYDYVDFYRKEKLLSRSLLGVLSEARESQ
jgi:hypothetical protein